MYVKEPTVRFQPFAAIGGEENLAIPITVYGLLLIASNRS
jgi:hypothetical protein